MRIQALERGMCSITERWLVRVLAPAKCSPLPFLKLHFNRGEISSRMRTVAEWLCLEASTPAPIYPAGTDLHHIRLSLCDDYLIGHAILLVE